MKALKILYYNISFFLFLFILVEIGFKVSFPDYHYYERTYVGKFESSKAVNEMDTTWVQTDSTLGWICRHNEKLQFYKPYLYDTRYCINQEGFRNPIDFKDLSTDKKSKRVLILGDSFVFGILQADSLTIPALLQKQLGSQYHVLNCAIPAWGLDQMYLAYQQYLDILKPDLVILFYIDDDISRLLEAFYWGASTKPSFKLVENKLAQRDPGEGKLSYLEGLFLFNSQILNRLYHYSCNKKAIPIARAILERWIHSEQNHGRQLRVVYCPRVFQLERSRKSGHFNIEPILEGQPATFYNLRDYMLQLSQEERKALYDIEDGHLSDRGARFAAEFLLNRVVSQ